MTDSPTTTTPTVTTPSLTTYSMDSNLQPAQLLQFEKNYMRTLNQTESKLIHTPAIKHMDMKGISNMSEIEDTELVDITDKGSNPNKEYAEIGTKNRQSVQKRFTRSYLLDSYDKCINLIEDPTGDLYQNLKEAMNRVLDRCAAFAATAPVYIGKPNAAPTVISAEDDGVRTIDGKTAFSYEKVISPAITIFKNNYVATEGVTLAISSNEEENLRNDDKYMNALYSNNNTVDKGTITNASGFKIVSFAGTENGGDEITNPILEEKDGIRTNLLLAPNAIGFASHLAKLAIKESSEKVNSWEITIDLWLKFTRRQGKRVIKILSTI